jgi:signal transduction histidine kinase
MNVTPFKISTFRHSISTRLLKIVLSIYFLLTFLVTSAHIYIEYTAAKDDIKAELVITERTFRDSLTETLWNMDDFQLEIAAQGITKLPSVIGVEIFNPEGKTVLQTLSTTSSSKTINNDIFWHEFPLIYVHKKNSTILGTVRLVSSNSIVFNRIKLGIFILIIGALIKTAALVLLITIVFNRLLTRPLGLLANEAENIDLNNIQNRQIKIVGHDESELKTLETALNKMMNKIVASVSELEDLNKELERKVTERTISLNNTVKQLDQDQQTLKHEVAMRMEKEKDLLQGRLDLQNSLNELKNMQNQLIESEKMASLGELVAGVAHEINTPVGLSLTGVSHFQYMLEQLEERYKNKDLEEHQFEKFISDAKEIAKSIHHSLDRAAGLVKSFKQVAVDQSHEVIRWFNVREYVDEVMLSLANKIKHTAIKVEIDCDATIEINNYPGSLSQIITNFISNSLIHAYKKGQKGTIKLHFAQLNDQLHFIYSDDGKGQDKEIQTKMFNPFFTTNREQGGSGLGLNIVYNLVTQKMKGSINIDSKPDFGTTFTIIIPIDIKK